MSVNSLADLISAADECDNENKLLNEFGRKKLADIFKEIGFSCTLCGKCCTKEVNDHVFLLKRDYEKAAAKYPDKIVPAPYFEVCDNEGNFYVSGYALKVKKNGDCVFLNKERRCTIYDDRFAICRVYPYMLHREPDEDGYVDWRQIAGLNEHGEYNHEISDEDAEGLADTTLKYESEFMLQERDFYREVHKLFSEKGLKPVRRIYDSKMREFNAGKPITIFVYTGSGFDKVTFTKKDYAVDVMDE